MSDQKLITQLIAVVHELEEACRCMRDIAGAAKINTVLLKNQAADLHALLSSPHGTQTEGSIYKRNEVLVEHNAILVQQLEDQARTLLRFEAILRRLDVDVSNPEKPELTAALATSN